MRILAIDRFEGTMAICEDNDRKLFGIETVDLPAGAKPGDVLVISEEGEISVDREETRRRKEKIQKLQNKLFR